MESPGLRNWTITDPDAPEESGGWIGPEVPDAEIETVRIITPADARRMQQRDQRRAARYVPGIPLAVMARAIAAHRLGASAVQIIAFHHKMQAEKLVTIRPSILAEVGISRRRWLRVLAALEAAGLIVTEVERGHATRVQILDAEYVKWLKLQR